MPGRKIIITNPGSKLDCPNCKEPLVNRYIVSYEEEGQYRKQEEFASPEQAEIDFDFLGDPKKG